MMDTGFERISHRKVPHTLEIVEPDPAWPSTYASLESIIRSALAPETILSVAHVGSTSVPGLPAKPVIDIDLVVADAADEAAYAAQLERAGFQFLFRELKWHEHRFFTRDEPNTNLHVFGPRDLDQVNKHRVFTEWLRTHPEDRERYAEVKREASRKAKGNGEGVHEYTEYKNDIILELLAKAEAAAQEGKKE